MRRLYVDAERLIVEPDWLGLMKRRIETEKPPLIIIRDVALNKTETSRFRNWAAPVMLLIEAKYELFERVGMYQFYMRTEPSDKSHVN